MNLTRDNPGPGETSGRVVQNPALPDMQSHGVLYDRFCQTPWYKDVNRHLLGLVDVMSNGTILDLGCGTGASIEMLAQRLRGGRIIGVDNSEYMLRVASVKFRGHPNITLLEGDISHLDMHLGRVGKVNKVFCFNAIHYLPEKEPLVRHVASLLDEGEIFAFNTGFYKGSTNPAVNLYRPFALEIARILRRDYAGLPSSITSREARSTPLTQEDYRSMLTSAGFSVAFEVKPIFIPRESVREFFSIPGTGHGFLPEVPDSIRQAIISQAASKVLDSKSLDGITQNWLYMVGRKNH